MVPAADLIALAKIQRMPLVLNISRSLAVSD
jgi:hypothetical protein